MPLKSGGQAHVESRNRSVHVPPFSHRKDAHSSLPKKIKNTKKTITFGLTSNSCGDSIKIPTTNAEVRRSGDRKNRARTGQRILESAQIARHVSDRNSTSPLKLIGGRVIEQ